MADSPSPNDWHGVPVDEELLRICAHNLFAKIDEALYFKDAEGRFLLISKAQARRIGVETPADAIGLSDHDFFSADHAQKTDADEREILRTGLPLIESMEHFESPGEKPRWGTSTKMVLRDFDGRPIGTFGISRDITRQITAELDAEAKTNALAASHAELLESQQQLRARQLELENAANSLERRAAELSAIADVARAAFGNDDVRTTVCAVARQLSGADVVGLLESDGKDNLTLTAQDGVAVPAFVVPLDRPSLFASVYSSRQSRVVSDVRREPAAATAIVEMVEKAVGHAIRGVVYLPLVIDDRCLGVLAVVLTDHQIGLDQLVHVLEILAQEAATSLERADLHRRLREQATHDVLTGLANRRAILDQLDQAIARARRHNRGLGLLYLDLDGFKTVNDSYGHATGDAVLVEVADRMRSTTRLEDDCGRIGGDEFVVICEDLEGEGESLKTRLADAITKPYSGLGVEVPIGASIGIAIWHPDDDAGMLLARADHAMYTDKASRGVDGSFAEGVGFEPTRSLRS